MRCVLVFLVLVLGLNPSSAKLTISSSCQSQCGKIEIPYPFGIGEGCYLNDWYEVQCRSLVPFLPKINKEVAKIHLPKSFDNLNDVDYPLGLLSIKTNITSVGCYGGDVLDVLLNFTETPFVISGGVNKLVAFGCDKKATLTHIKPKLVGCISSCDISQKPTIQETQLKKMCETGFKCCNANTAEDSIAVTGVRIENTTTRGGCGVAFLTDEPSPWRNIADPRWYHARKYATIQLKWKIMTANISFEESLRCRADPRYHDSNSNPCYCAGVSDDMLLQTRCMCTSGYKGNPYILEDCKDVDECKDGPKNCNTDETCLNIPGSYRCVTVNKKKPFLLYIGIGIGVGSLLVGVVIWLYKVIKKHRKIKRREEFFKRNGGLLMQQQLSSRDGHVEKTRIFTSKELEKATESFNINRMLGQGGQGTVYKGMLADGTIVAVKKSKVMEQDNIEEFVNEVVILSQVNHRNIVRILGCCLETEVPILVYEFISNGNLFQHLHNDVEDSMVITWEIRLQIAIDIAGAVSYLHSATSSPIYHRDIKSANIMLDEKFRAKVADFGSSRSVHIDHTHLTTAVLGTAGYVDPEYYQSNRFTEKSDVYSFGVVLIELITGEKPISFPRSQEYGTLASSFIHAMKQNRLFEIIDPRIKDECDMEQVTRIAKLAKICLNLKGKKRPSMREVSMELERVFSSHGDSLPELHTMGDDEEDEIAQFDMCKRSLSIDVPGEASTSQQYTNATIWSDVEPLYSSKTC